MIFEGCKCAKIEKTDKSTQNPGFNLSFCKVEVTICVNISENANILEKKARKNAIFCRNILQIRKIVVPLHRNQEKTRLLISRESCYIYIAASHLRCYDAAKGGGEK